MADEFPKFTAAAVQAAPEFLDREATVDKACHLTAEAAKNGAQLIVFPETWIPTYPFWDMTRPDAWLELYQNAVEVPSPATDRLVGAARKAKAYLVIGVNERDARTQGSLYNSLLYIGPDGTLLGVHRKLMPSVSERMRKLEERGVLVGYHAVVDAKRLHFDITTFIRVMVDGSDQYAHVIEQACAMDEVLEVHSITGEGSHILKVRTRNTTTLERLLSHIQAWPGVSSTRTSIVLSTFKETRQVTVAPTELFAYKEVETL